VLDASVGIVELAVALGAGGIVGHLLLTVAVRGTHGGQTHEAVEILGVGAGEEDLILAGDLDLGQRGPGGLATAHATGLDLRQVGQLGNASLFLPPGDLLDNVRVLRIRNEIGDVGKGPGALAPVADAHALKRDLVFFKKKWEKIKRRN